MKTKQIVIGFDVYNQQETGGVSMTLTAKRSDPHHVPIIFVFDNDEEIVQQGEADNGFRWLQFAKHKKCDNDTDFTTN